MEHCFCVLGWYFYPEFYKKLYEIDGDKFIISHRDTVFLQDLGNLFDRDLFEKVNQDIYFGDNRGLEWGGYHQFIEMNTYRNYEFIIFTHDDIVLKDPGFVEIFARRFADDRNLQVIGNGKNGKDWEFRFEKYKDRMFYQDADDFIVRTVRGSFFAARTSIFEKIENFPVKWKTKTPKKGNISLRNFGYLITKNFGRESISYLNDHAWLETEYVSEMVRGK